MTNTTQIREHMEVTGSDGQHVGKVDKVEGESIKLAKNDPAANGQHHWIGIDMVASVDQKGVRLNVPADQARQQWQNTDVAMGQASGTR